MVLLLIVRSVFLTSGRMVDFVGWSSLFTYILTVGVAGKEDLRLFHEDHGIDIWTCGLDDVNEWLSSTRLDLIVMVIAMMIVRIDMIVIVGVLSDIV